MGSGIKRLQSTENRWTNKKAKRHKHAFSYPIIVVLHCDKSYTTYFRATRCEFCNSFINAVPIKDTDVEKLKQHHCVNTVLHFTKPQDTVGFKGIKII